MSSTLNLRTTPNDIQRMMSIYRCELPLEQRGDRYPHLHLSSLSIFSGCGEHEIQRLIPINTCHEQALKGLQQIWISSLCFESWVSSESGTGHWELLGTIIANNLELLRLFSVFLVFWHRHFLGAFYHFNSEKCTLFSAHNSPPFQLLSSSFRTVLETEYAESQGHLSWNSCIYYDVLIDRLIVALSLPIQGSSDGNMMDVPKTKTSLIFFHVSSWLFLVHAAGSPWVGWGVSPSLR